MTLNGRRTLFWRKSHSQQTLPSVDNAGVSNQEIQFQPDKSPNDGEFVEQDVNLSSLFMPFIKNYVSNLSHHQSPTKLPYPPNFYYPASSLQHQMNLQMHHIDVLASANSLPTPQERFIAVLRYTLSTCNLTKFPYKPIIAFLGETAQSYTTHSDGINTDTTFYCAEQVERDPTASAFYICNPTKGFLHEGFVALVPKFKQAHVHVSFVGKRQTILAHPEGRWKETYVGDVPDLMIRLLRMHTELGGSMNLSSDTGFAASVQFKDKPIFGGTKNAVAGHITFNGREIFQIEGTWDQAIFLVDSNTHQRIELLNVSALPKMKVQTLPVTQQPETSGEREWGPLLDCLHRHDYEGAKAVKTKLDAMHHERLARFDAQGGFVPTMFYRTQDGNYLVKDPNAVCQHPSGHPTM